jgi:phage terminase small subunit
MSKLDPVREKFARYYVEIGNASEAYRKANPKALKWKPEVVHVKAAQIKADDRVRIRIDEIRADARKRNEINLDTVTQMLKEDRELARQLEQTSAAVSAAMGIAKLHGLIVDKVKAEVRRDMADMTDEELAAIATGRSSGVTETADGSQVTH